MKGVLLILAIAGTITFVGYAAFGGPSTAPAPSVVVSPTPTFQAHSTVTAEEFVAALPDAVWNADCHQIRASLDALNRGSDGSYLYRSMAARYKQARAAFVRGYGPGLPFGSDVFDELARTCRVPSS